LLRSALPGYADGSNLFARSSFCRCRGSSSTVGPNPRESLLRLPCRAALAVRIPSPAAVHAGSTPGFDPAKTTLTPQMMCARRVSSAPPAYEPGWPVCAAGWARMM